MDMRVPVDAEIAVLLDEMDAVNIALKKKSTKEARVFKGKVARALKERGLGLREARKLAGMTS